MRRGALAVCAAMALSVAAASCTSRAITRVPYQYEGDVSMWNHTFGVSEPFVLPRAFPAAIIIPHHDICTFEQNSFYRALGALGSPSVVVVLSPDHFEQGEKSAAVPKDTLFTSPEGTVPLAEGLIRKMQGSVELSSGVSFQDGLWVQEHGVFAHVPFIHHYFPKAKLLPVVLRPLSDDGGYATFRSLAQFLAKELPDDALVVASVDFSHYQIPRMTALHDEVSLNTVACMEDPRNLEVDSPESLYTLMEFCRLREKDRSVLVHRTCTFDKIPDELIESTSHQYWAFYGSDDEDAVAAFRAASPFSAQRTSFRDYAGRRNQTVILGGSGDMGAALRESWRWDRYGTSTDRAEVLLRDLAGKEARFLSGFDAYIFDVPPGFSYEKKKHGTTLSVTSLGWDAAVSLPEAAMRHPADGEPRIEMLVLDATGKEPSEVLSGGALDLGALLSFYDAVVVRDNGGRFDTTAYWRTDGGYGSCNLGIMAASEGNARGNMLVMNWADDVLSCETFAYESDTPVVPAIFQFPPDED